MWQNKNPNLLQYAYQNYNSKIHSTIDGIYANKTKNAKKKKQYRTKPFFDHDAVLLKIR